MTSEQQQVLDLLAREREKLYRKLIAAQQRRPDFHFVTARRFPQRRISRLTRFGNRRSESSAEVSFAEARQTRIYGCLFYRRHSFDRRRAFLVAEPYLFALHAGSAYCRFRDRCSDGFLRLDLLARTAANE
jgi:hypothetical protein